jgi:hypothetical protein
MGVLALENWTQRLKPGPALMARWLRAISEIIETRPPGWSEATQQEMWKRQTFRWRNRIHPAQGLAYRAGRLLT